MGWNIAIRFNFDEITYFNRPINNSICSYHNMISNRGILPNHNIVTRLKMVTTSYILIKNRPRPNSTVVAETDGIVTNADAF